MRESTIEAAANRLAKKLGWWERKFKSPGRRSAPDRIYAKNGHVFFIEFKAPGKRPTPLQLREHKRMRAAGFGVYVCASHEEYVAAFEYEERVANAFSL